MRILNWVMLIVFLSSCAVQFNDPDPGLWVFYYGVAALFTLLAIAKVYTGWAAVAAVGYVAGFVLYMPGWSLDTLMLLREPKMTSHDVELAREAVGLLICGVWLAALAYLWYRRSPGAAKTSESAADSADAPSPAESPRNA